VAHVATVDSTEIEEAVGLEHHEAGQVDLAAVEEAVVEHLDKNMNSKASILALILLSVLPSLVLAQNENDVLRYSQDLPGGSARSIALAGAIGAMGADLGAAQTNPAGLGLYRTSELVFSPSMEFNNTSTNHFGTVSDENRSRFAISNLGFLINYGPKENSKWKGSSFGLEFDRTRSFHWDSRARADGLNTSLTDQFLANANGVPAANLNSFVEGLAFDAFVLDPHPDTALANQNIYVTTFSPNSSFDQDQFIRTRGSTSNTNLFFAANHNHRFFIGASVGIVSGKYESTLIHRENTTDPNSDLQSYEFREDLVTSASGVNFKLGFLYRVGESWRIGAAVHTPTGWSLNDTYLTEVSSEFGNGDSFRVLSDEAPFAYRVSTPWKYLLSSAYVFGKRGLITAEYEYNDLRSGRLKESSSSIDINDFELENNQVRSRFNAVQSLRMGIEWRVGLIYFRGGYGFAADAFNENDVQHGEDLQILAGGLGYRKQRLSLDLGIQRYTRSNNFFAYQNDFVELSESTATSTRAVVTIAFRP